MAHSFDLLKNKILDTLGKSTKECSLALEAHTNIKNSHTLEDCQAELNNYYLAYYNKHNTCPPIDNNEDETNEKNDTLYTLTRLKAQYHVIEEIEKEINLRLADDPSKINEASDNLQKILSRKKYFKIFLTPEFQENLNQFEFYTRCEDLTQCDDLLKLCDDLLKLIRRVYKYILEGDSNLDLSLNSLDQARTWIKKYINLDLAHKDSSARKRQEMKKYLGHMIGAAILITLFGLCVSFGFLFPPASLMIAGIMAVSFVALFVLTSVLIYTQADQYKRKCKSKIHQAESFHQLNAQLDEQLSNYTKETVRKQLDTFQNNCRRYLEDTLDEMIQKISISKADGDFLKGVALNAALPKLREYKKIIIRRLYDETDTGSKPENIINFYNKLSNVILKNTVKKNSDGEEYVDYMNLQKAIDECQPDDSSIKIGDLPKPQLELDNQLLFFNQMDKLSSNVGWAERSEAQQDNERKFTLF